MASSSSRPRVAIVHDGFVPEFRVGFYERLAREGSCEYVVFHGPPVNGGDTIAATGPFAFPNVAVRNVAIPVGPKELVYQALVREVLFGGYDAIVLGAWLRFVSSLVLHPAFLAARRPVVLWGQGADKAEDGGAVMQRVLAVNSRLKAAVARSAGSYLVYTGRGAERLIASGVPAGKVHVVRNTLDMDAQTALHVSLRAVNTSALRAELGLRQDSSVLVYLGRVYPEKRVGELVEAVARGRAAGAFSRPVEVVVIGSGPGVDALRGEGVHLTGELRDQAEVARWLRVADAVVIPGKVGLAANHAFSQGVPLITRASDLHAPEIEYVEHGTNGLIVEGDDAHFTDAIASVVNDSRLRGALAEGALRTRDTLGLDTMVRAFDAGVRAAL